MENNKPGVGGARYWLLYFYYKMILNVFLSTDLSLLLFFSYVFKWSIRILCYIPFICPFGQVWLPSAYQPLLIRLACMKPPLPLVQGIHPSWWFIVGWLWPSSEDHSLCQVFLSIQPHLGVLVSTPSLVASGSGVLDRASFLLLSTIYWVFVYLFCFVLFWTPATPM